MDFSDTLSIKATKSDDVFKTKIFRKRGGFAWMVQIFIMRKKKIGNTSKDL